MVLLAVVDAEIRHLRVGLPEGHGVKDAAASLVQTVVGGMGHNVKPCFCQGLTDLHRSAELRIIGILLGICDIDGLLVDAGQIRRGDVVADVAVHGRKIIAVVRLSGPHHGVVHKIVAQSQNVHAFNRRARRRVEPVHIHGF